MGKHSTAGAGCLRLWPFLLFSAPFIPESPRWLAACRRIAQAQDVLRRIGGEEYSRVEIDAICRTLQKPTEIGRWRELFSFRVRKLC